MSSPDATASDSGEETAEEAPTEPDELREGLLERATEALGDAIVGSHLSPGDDLWIRVTREAWREAGLVLRDKLGCRQFSFLSAIDWLPSPYGRYQDAAVDELLAADASSDQTGSVVVETGYAGGDTRFQVFARAADVSGRVPHHGITLKADLPDEELAVDSWVPVYAGADWHEREAWEMYGITFTGHPYLRHLYLPGAFEGHPLRKDFPLLARVVKPWPGIVDVEPMPGEGEGGDAAGEGGDGA